MATLEGITDMENTIRKMVEVDRKSYQQISEELKIEFPGMRGLSARSVQRFCVSKNIHVTSRLSPLELSEVVTSAIGRVGPTYGRKTMKGFLASKGIRVGQRQIAAVMPYCNPTYHRRRQANTAKLLNPIPYYASYFGNKLHVDQNEKMVMYGVTHICAVDGFSGKIVAFASMPLKNTVEIYKHIFRPVMIEHGIWDQIRVDKGKEWVLGLFVQEQLAQYRTNTSRAPHLQTSSKQNHPVERMWVEINGRVNYPLKNILIKMEEEGIIDMDSPVDRYCVSQFTIHVANAGAMQAVQAWNEHPIPGKGIPNIRTQEKNRVAKVPARIVLNPDEAISRYHAMGGQLTLVPVFGADPLSPSHKIIRQQEFSRKYPDSQQIFQAAANGDESLFRDGLKYFMSITKRIARSTTLDQ